MLIVAPSLSLNTMQRIKLFQTEKFYEALQNEYEHEQTGYTRHLCTILYTNTSTIISAAMASQIYLNLFVIQQSLNELINSPIRYTPNLITPLEHTPYQ